MSHFFIPSCLSLSHNNPISIAYKKVVFLFILLHLKAQFPWHQFVITENIFLFVCFHCLSASLCVCVCVCVWHTYVTCELPLLLLLPLVVSSLKRGRGGSEGGRSSSHCVVSRSYLAVTQQAWLAFGVAQCHFSRFVCLLFPLPLSLSPCSFPLLLFPLVVEPSINSRQLASWKYSNCCMFGLVCWHPHTATHT